MCPKPILPNLCVVLPINIVFPGFFVCLLSHRTPIEPTPGGTNKEDQTEQPTGGGIIFQIFRGKEAISRSWLIIPAANPLQVFYAFFFLVLPSPRNERQICPALLCACFFTCVQDPSPMATTSSASSPASYSKRPSPSANASGLEAFVCLHTANCSDPTAPCD